MSSLMGSLGSTICIFGRNVGRKGQPIEGYWLCRRKGAWHRALRRESSLTRRRIGILRGGSSLFGYSARLVIAQWFQVGLLNTGLEGPTNFLGLTSVTPNPSA